MQVINWPFVSIRNKLVIDVNMATSESSTSDCKTVEVGEYATLQWLKMFINGVTLYLFNSSILNNVAIVLINKRFGKFLDVAVLDGRASSVLFHFNSAASTVAITVPHFWEFVGTSNFLFFYY